MTSPMLATTFDAAGDFSHLINPNGVWSYGWDDGSFHLMTANSQIQTGVYLWQGDQNGPLKEPTAGKNEGSAILQINSTTEYLPGVFALHPGRAGQRADLRWTAPSSGTFAVAARFQGLDNSASTDATIAFNGVSLGTSLIAGSASPFVYFDNLLLSVNDTIDFLVGFGANNNFYYDSTRVDVLIFDMALSSAPAFPEIDPTGLDIIHLDWSGEGGPNPDGSVPDTSNTALLLVLGVGAIFSISPRGGLQWCTRRT